MKFLISSDIRKNLYLRLLLIVYFTSLLFFLTLNIELEQFRFGLTPDAIRANILGDETSFVKAKDLTSLVTEIHINLFLYPLALLTTLSTLVHLRISDRLKVLAVLFPAICLFMDIGGTLLVRFTSPELAIIKIAGFWGFELSMISMVLGILLFLAGKSKKRGDKLG